MKRTGAVSWSTRSGPIRCADSTRAVTVDMNGDSGSLKLTRSIAGRSRSAARATSGEWNAPDTFSLTARRAPSSCASLAALVDGVVLSGDDDLPRAVVVRRPHAENLPAERLDHLVLEPEDRGHRAGMLRGRLGHRDPAFAHELERLFHAHRAGRRNRRELADGMADDEVRLDPARADRCEHREGRRDECRLLDRRVDERVGRARKQRCSRSRPDAELPRR